MSPLESKQYLASPTEVEETTKEVLDARLTLKSGRATYLKMVVAKTQANLGMDPRSTAAASRRINDEKRTEHLLALKRAHKEYYDIVKATVSARIRPGKERNAATGFARTSMNAIVKWVRAGYDITCLAPAKVTKYELEQAVLKHKTPSQKILANRVSKFLMKLSARITDLGKTDKLAAREAAKAGAAELTALAESLSDGRKLRTGITSSRGLHAPA